MREIRTAADVEADKEIHAKANDWDRFSLFLDGKDIPRTVDDPTFGKETLTLGGRFNLAVEEANKQAVADERQRCVECVQEAVDYTFDKIKNYGECDESQELINDAFNWYYRHTLEKIANGKHAMQSDSFVKWQKDDDAMMAEQARLKQMYATQFRINFEIVAYDKIRELVELTGQPISTEADEEIRGVVSKIVAEAFKV